MTEFDERITYSKPGDIEIFDKDGKRKDDSAVKGVDDRPHLLRWNVREIRLVAKYIVGEPDMATIACRSL